MKNSLQCVTTLPVAVKIMKGVFMVTVVCYRKCRSSSLNTALLVLLYYYTIVRVRDDFSRVPDLLKDSVTERNQMIS